MGDDVDADEVVDFGDEPPYVPGSPHSSDHDSVHGSAQDGGNANGGTRGRDGRDGDGGNVAAESGSQARGEDRGGNDDDWDGSGREHGDADAEGSRERVDSDRPRASRGAPASVTGPQGRASQSSAAHSDGGRGSPRRSGGRAASDTKQHQFGPPELRVFVGCLDWNTTDATVRAYFAKFGKVVDATVLRDRATGKSRGYGFVRFADADGTLLSRVGSGRASG